ncbi:MAG TPA: gephyrin-like molybdotransferase Glp [Reyranella sp.]|jgi:molybdopterin molybdotransferase|nr:gephyrin-like molybdotransferase Glp [Reyranella sp.]
MAQLSDDCFAFGGTLLSIDSARDMIFERVQPVAGIEQVPLRKALGRTLAQDVAAPIALPGYDNSAVDGYAARFDDLHPDHATTLLCVDRIAAGHDPSATLQAGMAARIFTGAILPAGADVVIMQEDCERTGDKVTIRPGIKRGANTRRAGEDVAQGARALTAGRRLGPADLGLLAALGFVEVPVRRKLSVALLSTGDEVREPGETLRHGQIHDANRYVLAGLLERLGVEVDDRGVVGDDQSRLGAALREAASGNDLIITSGGVSTGEEDHVRGAIANHGSLYFWRLAIKPGRPVAMGQIGATPLAGLPGNPVAALLTFALVARPIMEALSATTPYLAQRFRVIADFPYKKRQGRREYVRASLSRSAGGGLAKARRYPKEGAGMLTSLTETDGLVELSEETTRLEPGAEVDFIPYNELI